MIKVLQKILGCIEQKSVHRICDKMRTWNMHGLAISTACKQVGLFKINHFFLYFKQTNTLGDEKKMKNTKHPLLQKFHSRFTLSWKHQRDKMHNIMRL